MGQAEQLLIYDKNNKYITIIIIIIISIRLRRLEKGVGEAKQLLVEIMFKVLFLHLNIF